MIEERDPYDGVPPGSEDLPADVDEGEIIEPNTENGEDNG